MSFHQFDVTRRLLLSDYHPLTVRIFARATAIGATLPTDQQRFDTYIRSMVDIIIGNFDVFLRLRGTGDSNFKRINLANPEGSLSDFYGSYTLDNSGFKGNGVNAYVDTKFNPSLLVTGQKYQLNDASLGAVIQEGFTNFSHITGNTLSINNLLMNTSNNRHVINASSNTLSAITDMSGTGLKMINRTSATNVNLINKTDSLTRTQSSTSIANSNQFILRSNTVYGDSKVSSFSIGKSIPFEVSQAIRTAENADMANLGLPQIA